MTPPAKAPAPLRIIAWAAIVISASNVLGACMGLLDPAPNLLADMFPKDVGLIGLKMGMFMIELSRYSSLFFAAQLVIALAALWTGIALLLRRAWALRAMQAFCWIYLVWTIWNWLWWLASWFFIIRGLNPEFNHAMRIISEIRNAGWTAAYVIAAFLSLRYLRGPQARAAVATKMSVVC